MQTIDIMKMLHETTDIKSILNLELVSDSKLFTKELNRLIHKYNSSAREIINKTQLSRSYVYKVLNGDRLISKDKLLQIAICLGFSLDEINLLLKALGIAYLYPKIERDCIILYGIINKLSLKEVDEILLTNYHQPLQDIYA